MSFGLESCFQIFVVINRLPWLIVEVLVAIEMFQGLLDVIQFNEEFMFDTSHLSVHHTADVMKLWVSLLTNCPQVSVAAELSVCLSVCE